jgi:diaminopimelate epimerase
MSNLMATLGTAMGSVSWTEPGVGIGASCGTGACTIFNQLAKTRLIGGPAVRPTGPPGRARAG